MLYYCVVYYLKTENIIQHIMCHTLHTCLTVHCIKEGVPGVADQACKEMPDNHFVKARGHGNRVNTNITPHQCGHQCSLFEGQITQINLLFG